MQIGQTEPEVVRGTMRGEVCSKHKALKKRNSSNYEFLLKILSF